jgi:iron-sulfur cluster repair protein YtfE (RIC family)
MHRHHTRARLTLPPTEPLRRDHRRIQDLLRDYDALPPEDKDRREWIFRQIRRLLVEHISLEEELIYPELEKRGSEQAAAALKEVRWVHELLRTQLTELSELDPDAAEFDPKMHLLRLNLEQYAATEERTIFSEIRGMGRQIGQLLRAQLDRRQEEVREREE